MALSPGTRIGPYDILAPIGSGGMGEVYRARDTRLGRDVALKVLPAAVANHPDRRARFETEARTAGALNHPGIVTLHDIGNENGISYLVTEFIDGASLRQSRPEGLRRQLDLAAQIAEALAAAHASGITHRDLKPENIMVTRDGRAKILDFGLARQDPQSLSQDDETLTAGITSAGTLLGTIGYMSPEQARGKFADARSDIFSLGAVMYELFSGQRAFDGESPADILSAILRQDPTTLPASVPDGLKQIIEHCLEKDPARRFQSARDLAFALRALAGSAVSASPAAAEPVTAPAKKPRIFWRVGVLSAGVLILALAAWRAAQAPQQIDTSKYRFRPFATEDYLQKEPVWSPDGKSIAYVARPKADYELTVKPIDGSAPVVLTRSTHNLHDLSWTPDGSRIYYIEEAAPLPFLGRVWSVARAGGEPSSVMEGLAWAAALSPDGRTLATLLRERTTSGFQKALMLSSPPGSTARKIANFPGDYIVHGMAWSPDGRKILFTLNANPPELLLTDTRSGTFRAVTKLPEPYPMSSAWLPDSRNILAALPIGGDARNTALWLLDTETGKRIPALAGAEATSNPSLSVNGTVAYQTGSVDYDLVELPLDGSPVRPLLATREAEGSVAWSPVAPEFVYVSRESEIRVRRRGETREGVSDRTVVSAANFSTDPGGFAAPSFSPDGTRIAYTAGLGGWISAVSGGPPSSLGELGGYARGLSWSPDGHWIALNVAGLKGRHLVEVRVGSTDKPITIFNETCDFAPSWSPDASRILCSTAQALFTIAAHGTAAGTPEFLGKEYEHLAAWSKDMRFIYAIRRANGKRQLGKLDWKSGAFQPIVDVPPEMVFNTVLPRSNRLSVASDGKSLATTLQKETGNIWLLDGFHLPASLWRMFRP